VIKKISHLRPSPTLVKGAAFALAGLTVLAFPASSIQVLRLVLAGVLMVTGAADLWGRVRARDSANGGLRAAFAFVAGVGLLLTPRETVRVVELVFAAYLAALGVLAIKRGIRFARRLSLLGIHLGRGLFLLASALLIVSFHGALMRLALVSVAVGAVLVGLVMVTWALRHGAEQAEIADRALVTEVLWSWLEVRDVGSERRAEVADTVYFKEPDRRGKLISYSVMLLLSVALASLAILQDSTAVIIGAMLVAPLMTPIMGCAVGFVAGWWQRAQESLVVVALSVGAAISLAWVLASWIPALVPLAANSQVLSRASPTLIDMAIALAAGAAGAYATVDDRVSSSLPGVAIAVALVPPLGVVGVCLEAGLVLQALGAMLLFLTNLVSIILASMFVFVLVGFVPVRRDLKGWRAYLGPAATVAAAALLIMVPLGFTGKGVLRTAERRGLAQEQVADWLGTDPAFRVVRVRSQRDEVRVELVGGGELPSITELERAISASFGSPVSVTVELIHSEVVTSRGQDGVTPSP
jgi:uncharacterized hydrophobic protein (TIGR00271 family)